MSAFTQRLAMVANGPLAARVAVALLAALCLVLAVRLTLLLLGGPTLPVPDSGAGVSAASIARTTTPLAGWHLFGAADTTRAELAPTTLTLALRGTFASANPGNGIAFIADANGLERSYQVGDTLPGDAILESVHADHAIVRNGAQRERLGLSGAGSDGSPAALATGTATASPLNDPSGGYLRGIPAFGAPDLATARSALAPDLAALAQTANLLPVSENGRLIGVRIRVPDPALLERFGLSAEDVVTAVNGIPIDGPERRDALEQSLRTGGVVTLTVRRGGAERQLSLGL